MAGGRSVSFAEVSKRFLVRGNPLAVLDRISLDCPPGSFTALIGPSGCGKSTLLRIALGLESIDAGGVRIGDETPEAVRRRGAIGIVFQDPALLPWRSVAANIACRSTSSAATSALRADASPISSRWSVSPDSRRRCPASCPAGCANEWRSPAHW